MKNGIVWRALQSVKYYFLPEDGRKSVVIFFFLIISSLLDVLGLATLVPVVMAASRPGSIFHNSITSKLYYALHFQSEQAFLVTLIISLFFFFLFKNVFVTVVINQQNVFAAKLAVQIIDSQFNKFNNIPYWEFVQAGSSILINDTVVMPTGYVFGVIRQLFIFFSEIVIVSIIVIGIILYQPTLFFILALVLVPSTFMTYRLLRGRSQHIGRQLDELRPRSYRLLSEAFSGYIELKLAAKQPQLEAQLRKNQKETQALESLSYLYTQLPVRIIEMVAILAIVTIFLYSVVFLHDTTNLVTTVGLFAAAAYRLMPSMNRLVNSLVTMRQSTYAIEALEKYRLIHQSITTKSDTKELPFKHSLEIQNITFSFPESKQPVLKEVSFAIKKGERIGLIGSSGSGKTTLMNLLLRFYEQNKGQILVDGVPLTKQNLAAWYKLIGYVKQDTFLMEASIQDNITLNDEHVDEKRLIYALEQASLREFVEGLPEGVHTWIGERGSRLSGGQRQRIGIARALYKQTQVLLLDEATSALDNETEREVSEAISKLADTDLTIIIIAHRLTTLRDCNRIYELKEGELIAEHQYHELISRLH